MPKLTAMISQPMNGLTDQEIVLVRERSERYLKAHGYDVINTLFEDPESSAEYLHSHGVIAVPINYLARAIDKMSYCTTVYFCDGWENARGCVIEHQIAKSYGLEVIYESNPT